eukprot:CAMPEP_0172554618 /NCGR_PEP_ID=MMETSP1067-20121228/55495_1 /TAXON_ID=265564 ORGANISM="Thalassiosira punctigera, Strain Tpunct2005C2" /NCGR_SAMPLE_ID=MMETSP1067 /ASSEMBLY_ACC=CAM_ASM_000444 /LENGTH=215 /DNA_ID=CAMNT_0013343023 /DNA_START=153 /DNA_END=797 /DNA_ORIENTATION=+
MRLFGKKKPRRKDSLTASSGSIETSRGVGADENNAPLPRRQQSLSKSPTKARSRSQSSTRSQGSSRSRSSSRSARAAKQQQQQPSVTKKSSGSPTTKGENPSPTSILHQEADFGASTAIAPAPAATPPTFSMASEMLAPPPRVRFMSSGESVASSSEASAVHLMAGPNSVASSSAMSSSGPSGVLNKVVEEERMRLDAMGMRLEGASGHPGHGGR